ncbi:MAG: hypothetical protein HGA87_04830 [Desulfobulbaceae bacterium]|jgi:hypothetical protein|nr:hypothetical protein [Desulfobulbaceae bacterium]
MKDFTCDIYEQLLLSIKGAGYAFQTFEEFVQHPKNKVVVLRHDIDKLPENALKVAQIENKHGIKASYYFRILPFVYKENILSAVAALGHELSYHYEDLSLAKGDYEKAIEHFKIHLENIRKIYPAKTICMHGSPLSKWDNREIWKKYDYRKFGVIAEPYFDVDYNEVFYVTDTGRQWNKGEASVRDKVSSRFNIEINSTEHFIDLIKQGKLPDKIIINTHPQRWTNDFMLWTQELVMQNVKNVIKKYVLVKE